MVVFYSIFIFMLLELILLLFILNKILGLIKHNIKTKFLKLECKNITINPKIWYNISIFCEGVTL